MHLAVKNDSSEIIKILLKSGAKIDLVDKRKMTPLHIAFKNYRMACAEELLRHNADVCAQDRNGDTVLHFAIDKNRVDYVEKLVKVNKNGEFDVKNIKIALEIENNKNCKPTSLIRKKYLRDHICWQKVYDSVFRCPENELNHKVRDISSSNRTLTDNDWSKLHAAGGLRKTVHGIIFQVKLSVLFVKTLLEKNCEFHFGSEFLMAGDFDDIVIRYRSSNERTLTHRFVQVKHKIDPETDKITYNELTKSGGDFDLIKYYRSFCKIIADPLFAGEDDLSHIKDCILITNTDFDFEPKTARLNKKDGLENKTDSSSNANREWWKNVFQTRALTNEDDFLFLGDGAKINTIKPDCYDKIKDVIKHVMGTRRGKPFTDIDVDMKIRKFLEKFVFITNYPKEDDLDALITEKFDESFEMFDAKFITDSFLTEMINYLKIYDHGKAKFYNHNDGRRFLEDLKGRINTLMLTGLSLACTNGIASSMIRFNVDLTSEIAQQLHSFLSPYETNRIRFLNSPCTQLSMIKIWQILKSKQFMSNFGYLKRTIGGYIFTEAKQLLVTKEMFELSLLSRNCPRLLVIECAFKSLEYFNDVSHICSNFDAAIKIILIFDSKYKTNCDYVIDDGINFGDLTSHSQSELLEREVTLQSKKIKLNQLIDIDTAKEVMNSSICLQQLLTNSPIGSEDPFTSYGYVEHYYIDRDLREQWIKSDILYRKIKDEIIYISSQPSHHRDPEFELASYLEKFEDYNDILCFNRGGVYKNCIVLQTRDWDYSAKDIFTELCEKHRTVYWLELRLIDHHGDSCDTQSSKAARKSKMKLEPATFRLYWKAFRGPNASLLHEYIESDIDRSDVRLNELDLIGTKQRVVIIADDPGFGKSTFLTKLARTLGVKLAKKPLWIVRIDLVKYTRSQNPNDSDLRNELFEYEFSKKCVEAVEKFVTNIAVPNENDIFQRKLFEAGIHRTKMSAPGKALNIVVLIDGFDEISPDYKTNATNLIRVIEKTNVAQLWVTTRKSEKNHLENEFKTPALMLDPFSIKMQKKFLCRFWRLLDKTPNKAENVGHKFTRAISISTKGQKRKRCSSPKQNVKYSEKAKELIENAAVSNDPSKTYSLTEVPINLKILAEVVLDRKFNLDKINELIDIDIYTELIAARFKTFRNEKCDSSNGNVNASKAMESMFKNYRRYHELLALKHVFPEQDLPQLYELDGIDQGIKDNLLKIGFIEENSFSFIYQIFAECFVGEYLANNFRDVNARNLLIKCVFRKRNFVNICKFLKHNLQQNGTEQSLCNMIENFIENTCNDVLKQQANTIAQKICELFFQYPKNFQLDIDKTYVRYAVAKIPNDLSVILPDEILENDRINEYEIYRIKYRGKGFPENLDMPTIE